MGEGWRGEGRGVGGEGWGVGGEEERRDEATKSLIQQSPYLNLVLV